VRAPGGEHKGITSDPWEVGKRPGQGGSVVPSGPRRCASEAKVVRFDGTSMIVAAYVVTRLFVACEVHGSPMIERAMLFGCW
jgi:hypothetical protein